VGRRCRRHGEGHAGDDRQKNYENTTHCCPIPEQREQWIFGDGLLQRDGVDSTREAADGVQSSRQADPVMRGRSPGPFMHVVTTE
jgi:hypothetical protein